MDDIIVIGIAGGTGSGKTTITQKLREHFGDDVAVIYHDNYYKAHHDLSYEERSRLNYDHPNAFDTDRLVEDLKKLRAGQSIECPVYDYTIHDSGISWTSSSLWTRMRMSGSFAESAGM